jgi:large subunit ribosomal protein L25
MDFAKIDVQVRPQTGKGSARRTRAAGNVPGVLYGQKKDPVVLALDPRALLKSLDKERKRNTVFTLSVKSDGKSEDVMAMVRDAQIHPLTRGIVHVDFIRVSLDQEVRVTVPVELKGTAIGVVNGGTLHHSIHSLSLAAKPDAIPAKIIVDVSAIDVGEVIHVRDVLLPEGCRSLLKGEDPVVSIVMMREEVVAAAVIDPAAAAAAAAAPAADAKGGDAKAGDAKKPDAKKPDAKKADAKK